MKFNSRYILIAVALLPALYAGAQAPANGRFSIKATADLTLANIMSVDYAIPEISSKSSSSDFGLDFGWTFWRHGRNALEANIGVGYERVALKAKLPQLDYHYSAPADADMDNDTYIRYYRLNGLDQKIISDRMTMPVYLNYRYQISKIFSVHALAGIKMGFNVSSIIGKASAEAFSYGVYPQYDDLMIDASYMNEFGQSVIGKEQTLNPDANSVTVSFMAGVGAELRIWGPLAANVTLKYEGAVSDMYKTSFYSISSFDAENVPVKYTVADGQTMAPLTGYLTNSKLSRLSCAVSLVYRF